MGAITQTTRDLATGLARSEANVIGQFQTGIVQQMGRNTALSLDKGSKTCPIISECRNLGEGVTLGDSNQFALNAGLLAVYALPVGSAFAPAEVKVAMNPST